MDPSYLFLRGDIVVDEGNSLLPPLTADAGDTCHGHVGRLHRAHLDRYGIEMDNKQRFNVCMLVPVPPSTSFFSGPDPVIECSMKRVALLTRARSHINQIRRVD